MATGTPCRVMVMRQPFATSSSSLESYDALGRLATVTDPAGGVTAYTYDASHRITSITDARGITFISNEYDPQTGRVVRQTQADGGGWQFDYTLNGATATATVVTDPRGNPTTHRFSSRRHLHIHRHRPGRGGWPEHHPDGGVLPRVLPPETTAPTGRVLTAEAVPQPIPGVTVTLGSALHPDR